MNSYWNPLAKRRDVIPNANKCLNRNCADGVSHDLAVAPALIVIHTEVGTEANAQARFENPNDAGHASAHYSVDLDGQIIQFVDEKDAAYHAGNFLANMDSIGIEHEDNGDYNGPRTPELYAASSRLVHDISARYGIPLVQISKADYQAGRSGVIAHRDISDSPTACPDSLDIARILAGPPLEDDMPDWFTQEDWDADRWRLHMIVNDLDKPAGGPFGPGGAREGQETNKAKAARVAAIAELEAKIATVGGAHTHSASTTVGPSQ